MEKLSTKVMAVAFSVLAVAQLYLVWGLYQDLNAFSSSTLDASVVNRTEQKWTDYMRTNRNRLPTSLVKPVKTNVK